MRFRVIGVVFFIVAFFGLALPSFADEKERNVHGTFTYQPDESMSIADAKQKAFELLKQSLIEKEFNSTVNSYAVIKESDKGQEYFSLGEIESQGEWVSTVGTPKFELSVVDNVLFVTVTANGIIRKITHPKVDFSARVLGPGFVERTQFHNGEKFYLSFESPVRGYLAVYLYDGSDTVQCLLPYNRQETGQFVVNAGQNYVLFSKKKATDKSPVVEYILAAPDGPENNILYVIFSPNPFYKALDTDAGQKIPRYLSFQSFRKWIQRIKLADPRLTVEAKPIQIDK